MFCRLGATALKRQNILFLLGRGLPLLIATFEKPCTTLPKELTLPAQGSILDLTKTDNFAAEYFQKVCQEEDI